MQIDFFRQRMNVPRFVTLLAMGMALGSCSPTMTPERQATVAVDGPADAKGSGPLSPIGFDLARLYFEYTDFVAASGSPSEAGAPTAAFVPSDPTLRVARDRVVITAFAATGGQQLLADLVDLGLTDGVSVRAVVSGALPISALADAAGLESLRSMRPARMETR